MNLFVTELRLVIVTTDGLLALYTEISCASKAKAAPCSLTAVAVEVTSTWDELLFAAGAWPRAVAPRQPTPMPMTSARATISITIARFLEDLASMFYFSFRPITRFLSGSTG
jgi:hypothetical protein